MKKIKNKFIVTIIILISLLLSYGTYTSFKKTKIDRNSYVVLINGEAFLNGNNLEIDKKEKLNSSKEKKDKIKTIGEDSLVIIEWGDGSLTRVGGGSEIEIAEHDIEKDLSKIHISFKLLKGKSWSNVISFIGEGSYFKQYFVDKTAAVRGTIFEVNLEYNYLYVDKHEVKITDSNGKEKIVTEKKPFDIEKFNFIQLEKFILEIKDKTWANLNKDLDLKFFNILKTNLKKDINNLKENSLKKIENISDLSLSAKEKIYNKMMQDYQKINFANSTDEEIFNIKNSYRSTLVNLSTTKENKKNLVLNTLYDFKDSISKKNFIGLEENFKILYSNKNILKELNIDYKEYFNQNILEKINDFGGDLKDNFNDFIYDLDIEFKAKSTLNKLENNAKEFIKQNLK